MIFHGFGSAAGQPPVEKADRYFIDRNADLGIRLPATFAY